MNKKAYLNIVRGFAIYDLIALGPLALPLVAQMQLASYSSLHTALNLPGVPLPNYEPAHMLFVNLLGLLGVFWAIWRLRHTTVDVGIFEGWVRVIFSVCMFYYVFVGSISAVILVTAVIDLIAAPLHLAGYRVKASAPNGLVAA